MRFYTVGDPEIYDPILLSGSSLFKSGRKKDYIGGIIFPTKKIAEEYGNPYNYKVYEIITDINNTYVPEGRETLHLIDEAEIKFV